MATPHEHHEQHQNQSDSESEFNFEMDCPEIADGPDIIFPKASVDAKLLKLQQEVTEFVTSVILKHERDFYQLISKNFPNDKTELLGTTNSSIVQMITETTQHFYNKIYGEIQKQKYTSVSDWILEMKQLTDYDSHILLDKLFRLTLDCHLDVSREKLVLDYDFDQYQKSVLNQINVYLFSKKLLHILSKGPNDVGTFVNIPDNVKAFEVIIEKNIL